MTARAAISEAISRLIKASLLPKEDYVVVRRSDLELILATWMEKKSDAQ